MKWGKELLFLLPSVGYMLVKVALDNILQRTLAKMKINCQKHTRNFKFIAVKYVMVTKCKENVELNFSYLYSENIEM
jgi:hypothetical protein